MELHEIRYFLAVARARSFTRAAEACHVSQPALTRAVRKLEAELGGPLIARERGNLHLTGLGRRVEPSLRAVLAQAGQARAIAGDFLRLSSAEVRLGVGPSVGPARFTPFLARFRLAHPGIALDVVTGGCEAMRADLRSGALDLAVIAEPVHLEAPLSAARLYREPFVLACARTHPLARRAEIALRDLEGQIVLHRAGCDGGIGLPRLLAAAGVAGAHAGRSERDDWMLSMAAAGMGVCLLPAFSARIADVAAVVLREPGLFREVCAVTVAGREPSPALHSLLAAMRHHRWVDPDDDGAAPPEPGRGPNVREAGATNRRGRN